MPIRSDGQLVPIFHPYLFARFLFLVTQLSRWHHEFLKQAGLFLKLEEKPDVIADAMVVTEQNTIEFYQIKHRAATAYYSGYQVEIAVQNWLESTYPQSQLIREYQQNLELPRLDFLIIEPDGTRTGVEVRYFNDSRPFRKVLVEQMLSTIGKGQELDKVIIFIVTSDVPNAISILGMLENKIAIPGNVSLIIGHLGPGNQFYYVATLPNEPE